MTKLYHKFMCWLEGSTLIYTKDFDGEIRVSRLRKVGNRIAFKSIIGWKQANQNGTIDNTYTKEWWKA